MDPILNCWNCGKTVQQIHFCKSCDSLQPPTNNYYDFFGLDHKLNLDLKELERRFYTFSRRLHPDVYFRRGTRERQFALDSTAILNDAYRTLKDPIARANYLLKERGFDIGEQKSNNVPPELLEEVFELNMAVEELRSGDVSARPQLEVAHDRFVRLRDAVDRELSGKFEEYDRHGSRKSLAEIRGTLNRRNYIRNLVTEVEKVLTT